MYKVHQHLLHPVEHTNNRILLHGIEITIVKSSVVESHHTALAKYHWNHLVVHQGSNL